MSGKHFELILPNTNTECMNIFLEEIAKYACGRKIIIVMDGAGWHKSKDLKIPLNITILLLPPYSPELNPIERLWLHIKQRTIKNCIYETLDALEEVICDFIKNLKLSDVASICNINYMSIQKV